MKIKKHKHSSRHLCQMPLLTASMLVLIMSLAGCSPPNTNKAGNKQQEQAGSPKLESGSGTPLNILNTEGGVLPVVLVQDPSPATKAAAYELAAAIESIGGIRPEVIESLPDPLPERAIWVGYQPAMDGLFPGVDFALTQPEEIFLVGNENHIAITGRDIWDPNFSTSPGRRDLIEDWQREYGNANAVYTFLQDIVGLRWLYPGELGTDFPGVESLSITPFSLRYHPQFRYREGLFHQMARGYIKPGAMQDWVKHQRVLLHSMDFPVGHYFKDWWEKYGETRPELFALQPDGSRGTFPAATHHRKLCEGEPQVWETWLNEQTEHLKQFPYDVVLGAMPNDSYFQGHCTDPRSRAWDPDPSETDIRINLKWAGSSEDWPPLSDRYITFANTLAKMIKDRFPDKELLVATNAYGDVGRPKPVKAVPSDNVVIISVANFHMRHDEFREKHIQDFLNWAGIAKHIIWRPNLGNQGGRNWGMPDVHLQQAMEEFRFVAEHGAIGVMFDMLFENWAPMAPYYYLVSQLAWNPYADGNAILDDYFKRCYGPAAGPMKEYWLMMEKNTTDLVQTEASTFSALSIPDYYTPEFFAKANSLISQAKALAKGNEKFTDRIEFTECGLAFAEAITEIRSLMRQFEQTSGEDRSAVGEKVIARWATLEETANSFPEFAINMRRLQTTSKEGAGNKRISGLHPSSPVKKSALKAIKESGLDLD